MKIHCRFIDWILRMRAPQRKSTQSKFTLIFFSEHLVVAFALVPFAFAIALFCRCSVAKLAERSKSGRDRRKSITNSGITKFLLPLRFLLLSSFFPPMNERRKISTQINPSLAFSFLFDLFLF